MNLKILKSSVGIVLSAGVICSSVLSVSAEVVPEAVNENSAGSSAFLDYNPETNTYSLLDDEGESLDYNMYLEETDNMSEAVTEPTEQASETYETTTTIVSDNISETVTAATTIATTVTTTGTTKKNYYPAVTVPAYVGRTRAEVISERNQYLSTYTRPTTATTTKKTTTKVTTKVTTTTKKTYDGIDVSRWQGTINWQKVKAAGIDFVMIRAGYGMEYDQVDANFHTNIKGAQAAGIQTGVYWYSYAVSTSEALKEAKVCYNTIKGYKLSYPVAFDIEDPTQSSLSTTAISNITKVFCNHMESQKYYVSVYSYASFLKDKMNSSVTSNYDVWVAHTGVTKPNYSGNYGMWQYSHTGTVSGISGNVDLNYGYKNYPSIIKSNKLNGYS